MVFKLTHYAYGMFLRPLMTALLIHALVFTPSYSRPCSLIDYPALHEAQVLNSVPSTTAPRMILVNPETVCGRGPVNDDSGPASRPFYGELVHPPLFNRRSPRSPQAPSGFSGSEQLQPSHAKTRCRPVTPWLHRLKLDAVPATASTSVALHMHPL